MHAPFVPYSFAQCRGWASPPLVDAQLAADTVIAHALGPIVESDRGIPSIITVATAASTRVGVVVRAAVIAADVTMAAASFTVTDANMTPATSDDLTATAV